MLPKQYRLPLKTELTRIKKGHRIFPGHLFGLLIAPQSSETKDNLPRRDKEGPPRIGFIVSKKIHLKANRRNRVRRLMREAARALLPQFRPGWDFVFLAKKTILDQTLAAIKKDMAEILNEKIYPSAN